MAAQPLQTETLLRAIMRVGARQGPALRRRAGEWRDRLKAWLRAPGTLPWHLFLPPDFPETQSVEWRSPEGEAGRGLLSELPADARRSSLRAWTPAIETLLTVAQWPGRGRGKLAQALPYLLEDQLLMEPEVLAFSYRETDLGIFVAVTAKERLAAWRAAMDKERLSVSFCPVTLALPWHPKTWSCRFAEGQWAVRTGIYSGFGAAGQPAYPPAAFLQALDEARAQGAAPDSIILFGGDDGVRQMLSDTLACEVTRDRRAIGEGEAPPFRLGDTGGAVSATGVAAFRALRPTLIVIAAALVLGFTYTLFRWVSLARQESRVEAHMTALFTKTFPNAPVLDPAAQMRRGVARLAGHGGGGRESFLSILTLASPALASLPHGALTRIDYHDGTLRCAVRVGDFNALTALNGRLAQAGLRVHVTHVISHHGGVQADVVMTRVSP